jgi:hypothetical protein
VSQAATAVYQDVAQQPYFPALLQRAYAAYGAEITARESAGQYGTQSEGEFLTYLRSFVLSHPDASGVYRQKAQAVAEAERQRVAREAAEAEQKKHADAERERLTAAATNRRTNPLGRLAMGVATGQTAPAEPGPKSAHDARRTLRDRMRSGV